MKKILVATDGGPQSERVLEFAATIAEKFGSDVLALTVAPDLHGFGPPDLADEQLKQEVNQWAEQTARNASEWLTQRGIANAVPQTRKGHPAEEILAAAVDSNADCLILGTHSRRGIDRTLMGSIAEEVARGCRIPLMFVPF